MLKEILLMTITLFIVSAIFHTFLRSKHILQAIVNEPKIYAIVIKKSLLQDNEWQVVIDALKKKYNSTMKVMVITYESSIWEVKKNLSSWLPEYTCFIAKYDEVTPSFVKDVNKLTRELDDDPYGDTIWGIITGYTAGDALRLALCKGFTVRRVLSGTSAGWLEYVEEGITTSETEYGRGKIKYANGTIKEFKCPIDRTEYLVNLLNSNKFDIFITSGHGQPHRWQLHYPDPGEEGYFISKDGKLYGQTHDGRLIEIKSSNPKIYFGLGNCLIGSIVDKDSMPLAWIHSGGACLYTGYVIKEGPYSYQLGGIPAYFFVQDNYTWPESFFANNQALIFDMIHKTPGPNPDYLEIDKDGGALYGDPAIQVYAYHAKPTLYTKNITIEKIDDKWFKIKVSIKMNYDGNPGWTGKWGNRHPVILLPFKITNATILSTNAYKAVVTENFVLLYVWKLKDKPLKMGEERYVIIKAQVLDRPVKIEESKPDVITAIFPYIVATAIVSATILGILIIRKLFRPF